MAPPPPALMDELVEEFLVRLPPDDPKSLVHASLVCKDWRRILAGRGFRRRFRELHRRPPMLGFLRPTERFDARFSATSSFRPRSVDLSGRYALDSRHGRVLFITLPAYPEPCWTSNLAVWESITGDQLKLPISPPPPHRGRWRHSWNAAVLCAASSPGGGACSHLDCNRGPFLVVLLGTNAKEVSVSVYSSEAGAWSQPTYAAQHPMDDDPVRLILQPSAHSGNALYIMAERKLSIRILLPKFDLGTRQISRVDVPCQGLSGLLTATESGGLGYAAMEGSTIHLWSTEDGSDGDLGWARNRVIELEKMLPANTSLMSVAGFVHGLAVFSMTADGLFSFDV